MEGVIVTRHEIEEAVANANQLLITMRGIKGLVEICEISLNHTKLVDGLQEKKEILEKDIAVLEQKKLEHFAQTEKAHALAEIEYTKRIDYLKLEQNRHQGRVDTLNKEYDKLRLDLEAQRSKELNEFNAWMSDCHAKQLAANESLTLVTRQLDAIKAKLG